MIAVAPDGEQVIAFITAMDMVEEVDFEGRRRRSDNPKFVRWGRFLGAILDVYLDRYYRPPAPPLKRGQVLYMNIGGCRARWRSTGIMRELASRGVRHFVAGKDYRHVVGIGTHRHSAPLLMSMSMEIIYEKVFAEMNDPGLATITQPRAASLGVYKLRR